MKVVVNRGRTVQIATRPGVAPELDRDGVPVPGTGQRPQVQTCPPGSLLDLPADEAKRLIALGVAREYVPAESQIPDNVVAVPQAPGPASSYVPGVRRLDESAPAVPSVRSE